MPRKPKTPRGKIIVATGYGVKIYVERGHLVVHDGIGRDRETRRFNRATSQLDRVVVVGHTGFVTLEALRWIRDVGAVFVQIDSDSNLVTSTVSEWYSSSRELRRAQVLAAESETGLRLQIELISEKLERQAEVAAMLAEYRPTLTASKRVKLAVADAIRAQIEPLQRSGSMAEMRKIESIAGRYYWQTFAHLPLSFDSKWRRDGSRPLASRRTADVAGGSQASEASAQPGARGSQLPLRDPRVRGDDRRLPDGLRPVARADAR